MLEYLLALGLDVTDPRVAALLQAKGEPVVRIEFAQVLRQDVENRVAAVMSRPREDVGGFMPEVPVLRQDIGSQVLALISRPREDVGPQ